MRICGSRSPGFSGWTALILTLLPPATGRADIYTVSRQGGAIIPVISTDVSMDAETVLIERGDDGFAATATFLMRNQSDKAVECTVAFPVTGSSYSGTLDINREFKVRIKSGTDQRAEFAPVVARLQINRKIEPTPAADGRAFAGKFDFPECVLWEAGWAPGETKTIQVSYDMGAETVLSGSNFMAGAVQMLYIVRTGALWKGPIGKADITMRGFERRDAGVQLVSYPQQAHWNGPTEVSWHFENWKPTEDIWFKQAFFGPVTAEHAADYFFFLPIPYAGGEVLYGTETIERLVERDLTLAKEYFPKEAASYDRRPLRQAIAEWLFHELFARNGDPFFIGKHVDGQPSPKAAHGYTTHDGNYIGEWRDKFNRYGGMKGWYRPKPDVNGQPPKIELAPMEKKNADFLKSYLEKLGV